MNLSTGATRTSANYGVRAIWPGSVQIGKHIYFTKGHINGSTPRNFVRYDIEEMTYTELAPTPGWRYQGTMCALNNKIYFIGGRNHGQYFNDAYCYDIASDSWSAIKSPPLTTRLGSAIGLNNMVIVAFGSNDGVNVITRGFQIYNPATDDWSFVETAARNLQYTVLNPITIVDDSVLIFSFTTKGLICLRYNTVKNAFQRYINTDILDFVIVNGVGYDQTLDSFILFGGAQRNTSDIEDNLQYHKVWKVPRSNFV